MVVALVLGAQHVAERVAHKAEFIERALISSRAWESRRELDLVARDLPLRLGHRQHLVEHCV